MCDCVLRDSQSYLDHINGKYHNRALGMSMNVERSTTEQVRSPPACSPLCMTLYLTVCSWHGKHHRDPPDACCLQVRSRLEEVKKIKERGSGSDEVYVADGEGRPAARYGAGAGAARAAARARQVSHPCLPAPLPQVSTKSSLKSRRPRIVSAGERTLRVRLRAPPHPESHE